MLLIFFIAFNGCSNSSGSDVLPQTGSPEITGHPISQTVTAGQAVTFTVDASGTATLHYQWKKGIDDVGTDSAIFTIPSVQASDAGSYTVTVANDVGDVVSQAAILTVAPFPATPTVSLTAPTNGATVSGSEVAVAANASSDSGISKVEFYINNVLENTDTASPYIWTWDTTAYSNDSHAVKAIAYDTINQTAEMIVSVSVNNGGLRGWQVTVGNTGLAGVGVDKNTLPVYNETNPIPAGSTISMKKLIDLDFTNGNITVDRCWIVMTGNPSNSIGSPYAVNTVQDSDIEATHYQGSPVGNRATNKAITVLRCNISGGQALVYMNGPGTIQQCYLHDMISAFSNHCDGFTRRIGTEQVNFIDNYLDSYTNPDHTSATVFLQTNSGFIDNILFQGNFFKNGNTSYARVALEKKDGNAYGTHLIMDNNRFYPANGVQETVDPVPGIHSHYGYTYDYDLAVTGPGWGQWTNNYVYDPSKPDSKGALILEPSKAP